MRRTLLVSAPLLAFVFAAACSSDTSPIQITTDDVNQAAVISASDATSEDVAILTASDMTMSGGAVQSLSGTGSGLMLSRTPVGGPSYIWTFGGTCTYSSTTGRFTCPPITSGGLTLNRDYAFYDASNVAESAYDPSLTASANFHVSVTGVHLADAGADTVNRDRNLTVSGLAGAETSRLWNGTGTRTDGGYRTFTGVTRTYHVTDNVTIANIVVDLPRSSNPWPMSGTITRQISGTASVVKAGVSKSFSVTKTVVITFNGTQDATVTIGTSIYTLDLSTGTWTKVQ